MCKNLHLRISIRAVASTGNEPGAQPLKVSIKRIINLTWTDKVTHLL